MFVSSPVIYFFTSPQAGIFFRQMLSQKLATFLVLIVFASQSAMAAPAHFPHPSNDLSVTADTAIGVDAVRESYLYVNDRLVSIPYLLTFFFLFFFS